MADENSTTTVTEDGELAVKVLNVSGTLVSGPSIVDTTALVQTEAGIERAVKSFPLGGGGGGGYVLPTATDNRLGGIKVGENLSVEADGTLNAQAGSQYELPPATADTLGGIKVGQNLSVESDGTLNATGGSAPGNAYTPENLVAGDGIGFNPVDPEVIIKDMTRYNYATINNELAFGSAPFSVEAHVKTPASGHYGAILGPSTANYPCFQFGFDNNNRVYFNAAPDAYSPVGIIETKSDPLNFNTEYWVKAEYTGTRYNLYVGTTKDNMQVVNYVDSEYVMTTNSYNIGTYVQWSQHDTWTGEIWLSELKVTINNVVVFDGSDSSQYTIVGSPTIVTNSEKTKIDATLKTVWLKDKMGSSFDVSSLGTIKNVYRNGILLRPYTDITKKIYNATGSQQYVKIDKFIDLNSADNWCISFLVKNSGSWGDCRIMSNAIADYTTPVFTMDNNRLLHLYLSSNGTSWSFVANRSLNLTMENATDYYLRLGFTGSKYYFDAAKVGGTWQRYDSFDSTTKIYSNSSTSRISFLTTGWESGGVYISSISLSPQDVQIFTNNQNVFNGLTAVEGTDWSNVNANETVMTAPSNEGYKVAGTTLTLSDELLPPETLAIESIAA